MASGWQSAASGTLATPTGGSSSAHCTSFHDWKRQQRFGASDRLAADPSQSCGAFPPQPSACRRRSPTLRTRRPRPARTCVPLRGQPLPPPEQREQRALTRLAAMEKEVVKHRIGRDLQHTAGAAPRGDEKAPLQAVADGAAALRAQLQQTRQRSGPCATPSPAPTRSSASRTRRPPRTRRSASSARSQGGGAGAAEDSASGTTFTVLPEVMKSSAQKQDEGAHAASEASVKAKMRLDLTELPARRKLSRRARRLRGVVHE
eukprot:TRINITY_DN23250_c0_g1_i1.p2 TRINITY_DN23250_c0_g1~~TRINITY_DN23250_c0_g1_i1.p2  ORF type:complete len:295 (+),score=49.09 TRINITY_DN23250_c0_g1_i1:104-886(+)